MTNKEIRNLFRRASALMEIHNENPFKIRMYANGAISIENLPDELETLSSEQIDSLEGIAKSIRTAIQEIRQHGSFSSLDELEEKTPEGIIGMTSISGLGPKKIRSLWKDLDITSIEDLYQACKEGKLAQQKGFGIKTQENLLKTLEYLLAQMGNVLLDEAENYADWIVNELKTLDPDILISRCGTIRRKMEVISVVEILIAPDNIQKTTSFLDQHKGLSEDKTVSGPFSWKGSFTKNQLALHIHFCKKEDFYNKLLLLTGTGEHLSGITNGIHSLYSYLIENTVEDEPSAYKALNHQFVPPEMREGTFEPALSKSNKIPELIEYKDLKGIIHNHSTYSDGKNTLREMAEYCKKLGFEYLGISDHSKSAFYANGLIESKIIEQHKEIDHLNQELEPFRIFKGIESDILSDGGLDYDEDVLKSFDFIIASIHSAMNMDTAKATQRLINAIKNPNTTFLGHPTGRLLLRREGYPIDHKAIIDACAEHKVIIEINSNPRRLDLDWRWIRYAIEKGVLLSINPDAHETSGYHHMHFGVCTGRKGGLSSDMTFNALPLKEVENYFIQKKSRV